MARTDLTVQNPGSTGATTTRTTPDLANGNAFTWPGVPVTITLLNTNGTARNMTLKSNGALVGPLASSDKAYNIPLTSGDKTIVLDDPAGIVQSDGKVWLDWDAVTGVTIALTRAAR
jgi:hypothetical protein